MERQITQCRLGIGDPLPYFSLPATDGRRYLSSDFKEALALVVVFSCNHCPFAQIYEPRLVTIAKEFEGHGVRFISICANDDESFPEDSFEKMVEKSTQFGFPYPYLHDKTQVVARAFDAVCTPEVYVFNKSMKLCYHGRPDDNHKDERLVTAHYLRDTLQAILSGEQPVLQETPCIGCAMKWKLR